MKLYNMKLLWYEILQYETLQYKTLQYETLWYEICCTPQMEPAYHHRMVLMRKRSAIIQSMAEKFTTTIPTFVLP